MTKRKGKGDGAERTRAFAKEEIKKQFGIKVLGKAMLRLCKVCQRKDACLLYPITTRGEDCPYFKEVNNVTNNSNTG